MKISFRLRPALFLACLFLGWIDGRAAVLLSFANSGSAVTITQGDSFSFGVYLTLTGAEQVTGFDYFLQGLGSGYSNEFSIVSRITDPADFPDANNSDAAVATPPASVLGPINGLSLGATVADPFLPLSGPGTYQVATITLASAPGIAPGTYSISALSAAWFDENFDENPFSANADYSVTVNPVPEPSSAALLGLFLLGSWRASRRRRR